MKTKTLVLLLSGLLIAAALILLYHLKMEQAAEPIHIAFVGPLTGPSAKAGKIHLQGAQLFVEQINRGGGINERPLTLDIYDDANDKVLAVQRAQEIAAAGKAVAVIGHNYSSCSAAAGQIYQKNGIPAVSPSSTGAEVTLDNPWYFRTVFNNPFQGRFLANYIKKVMGEDKVSVIHEDLPYGSRLAAVFSETAADIGLDVIYKRGITVGDSELDWDIARIVADLGEQETPTPVFLSLHAPEGVRIVRELRDAGLEHLIIAPDAFATQIFSKGFSDLPKEQLAPGFYTNGIYVSTPIIFDTANEKAQHFETLYTQRFGEAPGWHAAYTYDTALLIAEAIGRTGAEGRPETLEPDREKIRDFLAGIDSVEKAVEGVTGYTYFNENGDPPKPVSIGVWRNNNLISALTQLQMIRNLNEIIDLPAAMAEGRVLVIDGKYMYRTNVVYTGIRINQIREIDFSRRTCRLDFNLWFRYGGRIDVEKIRFINAVDPIKLGEPVKEDRLGDLIYKNYHVEGDFKIDFLSRQPAFGKHVVGIRFFHQDLSRNNLIYVIDVVGLNTGRSPADQMREGHVMSSIGEWTIAAAHFFQEIVGKPSLGSPEYLNIQGGMVEHSSFNLTVEIRKRTVTPRRKTPEEMALYLLIICGGALLLLQIFFFKRPDSKGIWLLLSGFTLLFLLFAEVVAVTRLTGIFEPHYLKLIILAFDIAWWIIPAYLLKLAVERFIWTPLEQRTHRTVPNVLRRFVAYTIYVLAFFGIIAFVFDQRLTSLLATSGVLAMILGLAIQINISNIFSGIAINMERPFRIGDWIKIGDFSDGRVVDITWRTTRIQTGNGCILSIPNSQASESAVQNFSYPDGFYKQIFTVQTDPVHPPARVKKILMDSVLAADAVIKSQPSLVRYLGINQATHSQSVPWAANYLVIAPVWDYSMKSANYDSIWERIWTHLNRAGIRLITQRQDIHLYQETEIPYDKAADPISMVEEVDIFTPFPRPDRKELSRRMRLCHLQEGEKIFSQGEEGDSLFIISEGVMGIWVKRDKGDPVEVARLGAGHFFGEMSLLTGEPRTATVQAVTEARLFEVTKADIESFMEPQPDIARQLGRVLARRKAATESAIEADEKSRTVEEAESQQFFQKIRAFFGF